MNASAPNKCAIFSNRIESTAVSAVIRVSVISISNQFASLANFEYFVHIIQYRHFRYYSIPAITTTTEY